MERPVYLAAPPHPNAPTPPCKKAKKQQGKMPKKGGKRGAQSRDAGAKGGRPKKKPAAADAVLQQPAAPQPPAKKALLGRSGRTPLLECTDLTPWREGASFVFNALFPLFALYAPSKQSREARPCVFSMQCLLLEKRAGETTVCVSQHNIPFKKKHRGGGHMRGSN